MSSDLDDPDLPQDTNKLLAAALRITMIFYVLGLLFPPAWRVGLAPALVTSDMGYRERWAFDDMAFINWPVVLLVFGGLFLLILVLSFFCRISHPGLARTGFLLLPGSLLYLCIMLPAVARAREKPVIYLYPPTEMTVSVQLHYDGILTESIPQYPKQGWTVTAAPSGTLTDPSTGKTYPYLFWEGRDTHVYTMNEGFVVPGSDTATFLNQALTDLGLSTKEIADFSEYWTPRMTPNRYNFIHFATDEYSQHIPLEVTPKPDTVIRVFMLFRALDAPITVAPQHLTHPTRTGFTVVEWGGTELTRWQFTRR